MTEVRPREAGQRRVRQGPASLVVKDAMGFGRTVLLLLIFSLSACGSGRSSESEAPRYATFAADVMATTVQVTVPADASAAGDAEAVFEVFREVDARMSEWKESSPLSEVNRRAGGEPVAVPADLREVLRRAKEIASSTGGAFDPTWAALWGVWDFRSPEPTVPPDILVAERAALVDWRKLEIDEAAGTVRLAEPGMVLGLGGIAKGHALDRGAEILRSRGVGSFLLVAGGQVYAGGERRTAEGARPWRVGIRDPRGAAGDFFAWLELADASASTSGDYESWFEAGGVRYHHVLDPRTGRPARGLAGVTVVSADATLADALSTAVMVMGRERGLALVESLDGVEAVVVGESGEWRATAGLGGRLELVHPPRGEG
jgi:thiamine biosynthesis lipoprotein